MSNTRKDEHEKKKPKQRLSLFGKAFIYFVVFIVSVSLGTLLLKNSFFFRKDKVVNYTEKSNLDYKVYLKENDFYEDEYLGKDMLYVATLIDKIAVDFDYNFNSEANQDIEFTYSIIANLSITNPTGTKSFFEKKYPLVEEKKINLKNGTSQLISEKIKLDYPYYNTLANSFKSQYGVDSESKLTVYMVINKSSSSDNAVIIGSSSVMNVSVPLSERAVDIRLDYKEINETSSIIQKDNITIKDYIPFGLACGLLLASLIMAVNIVRTLAKMIHKKSIYDRYVSKLLKEYDRLIAESSTLMSFKEKEIINIKKFTELLDIHDNLQLPIMYYEVTPHDLCYFYINHENVVYLLELSSEELESENN